MLGLSGFAYFLLVFIIALEGRRREIGFGWPFLLGLFFTPLISLVLVLFSEKLPNDETKWGCFWPSIILMAFTIIAIPLMLIFGAAIVAFIVSIANGGMMNV